MGTTVRGIGGSVDWNQFLKNHEDSLIKQRQIQELNNKYLGNTSSSSSGTNSSSSSSGDDRTAMMQSAKELAQQQLDHSLKLMDASSSYRSREADQQFGFDTRRADQDSGIRMRESDQQFGFSRTLQKDNNDVRERMQQAGFNQDRDMTIMRDRLEDENIMARAKRAANTFRGKF